MTQGDEEVWRMTGRVDPKPHAASEDVPCVGCGEPTRSRTDDGRPKHVGCPDVAPAASGEAARLFVYEWGIWRKDEDGEERQVGAITRSDVRNELRALLRAESGGLDVERLARAFDLNGVNWPKRWGDNDFVWLARQVAAEYARLAEADR